MTRTLFTITRAEPDQATHTAIADLLITQMYPEVGQVPLKKAKTMAGIYDCLINGVVFNAMAMDGRLAGSLGAMPQAGWWYSDEVCLFDRWYFVSRLFRGSDVGKQLEDALRAEAAKRKMQAYIAVSNPNRLRRPTPRGPVAEIAAFQPFGRILRIDRG